LIKNANRINQLPTYVPGKPIEELKRYNNKRSQ